MKRTPLLVTLTLAIAVTAGCATLDAKQREWIFQPSDRSWGGAQSTADMQDVWIDFQSDASGKAERLHGLWLAQQQPGKPRYIFGHSLGGAIAIDLARQVPDEQGTMVEGTFTSIPDVVSTFKWGWLPVSGLITQRFESVRKVAEIGSPLLVVHGSQDSLIQPALGRKLFEAAQEPKQFVLVEGGSHHNTNS